MKITWGRSAGEASAACSESDSARIKIERIAIEHLGLAVFITVCSEFLEP